MSSQWGGWSTLEHRSGKSVLIIWTVYILSCEQCVIFFSKYVRIAGPSNSHISFILGLCVLLSSSRFHNMATGTMCPPPHLDLTWQKSWRNILRLHLNITTMTTNFLESALLLPKFRPGMHHPKGMTVRKINYSGTVLNYVLPRNFVCRCLVETGLRWQLIFLFCFVNTPNCSVCHYTWPRLCVNIVIL